MAADLDSAKDVDCAARNSPAGKQDKTVRRHSQEKTEGKQPGVNLAGTSDTAEESFERREWSKLRPFVVEWTRRLRVRAN